MAATRGQKRRLAKDLGMFLAEIGKVPTQKEYGVHPQRPRMITLKEINRIAGSWHRALMLIENEQPELWELANKKPDLEVNEFVIEKPKPPKIDIPMAKTVTTAKKGKVDE
jgi:hypothetical protein